MTNFFSGNCNQMRAISGAEEDAGHRGSTPWMCQKDPSSTEEDHGTSGIVDGATRSTPWMCQCLTIRDPSSTEEDHGTSGIVDGATRSTPWMCQKDPSSTEEDHGTSGIVDGATRATPWMCQKDPSSTEEDHGTSGIVDGATRSTPWMCQKDPSSTEEDHGTSGIVDGATRATPWMCQKGPSSTEEDHGTSGIVEGATRSTPWMCQKDPSSTEEDHGTSGIVDGATRSTPWMCFIRRTPAAPKRTTGHRGSSMEQLDRRHGCVRRTPAAPKRTTGHRGSSREQLDRRHGCVRRTPAAPKRTTGHRGSSMEQLDRRHGCVRIKDWPNPRGEIHIGGSNVAVGYFKQPEKTLKAFYEENGRRWFRTGDIGEFTQEGFLKVIDRQKDLVKLQHGEYVSLGKVESELKINSLVDNICIYADPTKMFPVALLVPNFDQLKNLAEKSGIELETIEDVSNHPRRQQMEQLVLKELQKHAVKCRLQKFEVPQALTLLSDIWTPDTGLVTAAFKLKRKNIQDHYQFLINRMYF
ncbi:hypothetical protein OUZ56_020950 [Daphnia magna]|uniref:Long-chain-fatty-acid--CoA ligase n=1 Tax=Daphnia magna TaxID=35525 RepID=A0ABQ9ZFX7_9CRUS|nr:hypothetical protein OUZ56_020950 [Daphnia magna]